MAMLTLPRNILVPVDFGPHAEAALDYAQALSEALSIPVHALHVYELPTLLLPDAPWVISADLVSSIENASKKAMSDLIERRAKSGLEIEGHVKCGDPRAAIEAAAEELEIELICMGTHGRRGLSRALLGSVAEFIVRTSKVPVLTVHAPQASSS
jgi:nucleotide-binding universal stress UspA family protein